MTTAVLEVAGAVLVLLVLWDVFATTSTLGEGAGPLTRRFLARTWRLLLHLHRRHPDGLTGLLGNAGAALLVATVLIWVVAFWTGWTLVFAGSGAIVRASTGEPASVGDVAYYAGFAVSTLGMGDFTAASPTWRVLTSVAGFTGLVVVTMAITYLLSVVSAVVSRRAFATRVHALGDSAPDIVLHGWSGTCFSPLFVHQLLALPEQVALVAEQHLAYPVLQYFRSRHDATSAPVAFARLDEAMLLLEAAVVTGVRPSLTATRPVRRAVARYVTTAGQTSAVRRPVAPPALPDVRPLSAAGIPLVPPGRFRDGVEGNAHRRRQLRQLVEGDGRSWDR
jgi:Ion channel